MILVLAAAGLLCLLYFYLLIRAGVRAPFVWFWTVLGGGFLGLALWQWLTPFPEGIWIGTALVLAVVLALGGRVAAQIFSHYRDRGEPGLDVLVVLGAQVWGTQVSRSLQVRLEAALGYLKNNPETVAVVTGGQGSGEAIPEAEVMARWLIGHGISERRIRQEKESTSTRENLLLARPLFPGEHPRVGIVTSDFHLYRALEMARALYPDLFVCGVAAPSEPVLQAHYLIREFLAVLKARITGIL